MAAINPFEKLHMHECKEQPMVTKVAKLTTSKPMAMLFEMIEREAGTELIEGICVRSSFSSLVRSYACLLSPQLSDGP